MADRVGQQLGNYRLIRLLGRGGFAEVYLGEHVHLCTQAAIKILHTQVGSQEAASFRQEARTIAGLKHAHIVRVLDFGLDSGTPYLVMDYAPNGTLRERHPTGTRVPLDRIVSYVKQVAQALHYAHERRLIHRDVKPQNLLVGEDSEVLLSDFGIATIAHRTVTQSMQQVAGTALYMAPEQFQGQPRLASDQYALGVIVYEWLCGERPFHGSFPELYGQHLSMAPPSLRAKVSTIPREVEQVVMTALAKDPKQRFATVQAFATALEQASKPTPVVIATDWVMFGFDAQRTGYNPHEHILSPATVPRLVQRWVFPTGGGISSSPAVANGVVYICSRDKKLYALDASTGATRWAFPTKSCIDSSPAVANGVVYVGSRDSTLYALDAGTGTKLWTFPTGGSIYSSPAVANGVVYVGSFDKSLYALDASTSAQLWAFPTKGWIISSPAVVNGMVYVSSLDHDLYAFGLPT